MIIGRGTKIRNCIGENRAYNLLCFHTIHFYRHPLFPILSLLLEKCEIATHSIDVLPPINLTWEARKLILPKLLEGTKLLELPDDTELNDLVMMRVFL